MAVESYEAWLELVPAELKTKIIRLVLRIVPQQRGRAIREPDVVYSMQGSPVELPMASNGEGLEDLLRGIPFSD
jgi:hypothetical protein